MSDCSTKRIEFKKLIPESDIELGVYENAFDYVFENDDVLNIAVTGNYGSGKSSLIRSYDKKRPSKKFIYISLGSYDEKVRSENASSYCIDVLEAKILNQLIQQIPEKKIPQSHFSKKTTFNKWRTGLLCMGLCLIFLCFYIFISFNEWTVIAESIPYMDVVTVLSSWYFRFACGGVGLLLTCRYLFLLFRLQKNKNLFKRVKFLNNEIDIVSETDESYFDKYLNEVVYLFQKSDCDAIVFEDMDRFDSALLFSRLREINKLVNDGCNSPCKPIKFFYLLKDDMFSSENRTKFFDFIIPVVPILNGSNSYGIFEYLLKHAKSTNSIESAFLKDVSLYIDDMRILKNVCNEFVIYDTQLEFTEPNDDKLLALIIYKNIFPEDFCKLQCNTGFLYDLMHYLPSDEALLVRNQKNDLYKRMKTGGNRVVISDLRNSIDSYSNKKLSEQILEGDIDQIFEDVGKKNEYNKQILKNKYVDLVKYLVRNEYIDESYLDYMSYLDPASISRNDKIFVRSVKDHRLKNPDYHIESPEKVLPLLRNSDFDQKEILNYDLLDYISKDENDCREQVSRVINQIVKKDYKEFLYDFLMDKWPAVSFMKLLFIFYPLYVDAIVASDEISDEKKCKIIESAIYGFNYASDDIINSIIGHGVIYKYLDNNPDFLNIENPDIELFVSGIYKFKYSFKNVNLKNANRQLWDELYRKDCYQPNIDMISEILKHHYGLVNDSSRTNTNVLSLIMKNPESPLCHYIYSILPVFLDFIEDEYDGIDDDYSTVINIINRSDLDIDRKKRYIRKLLTVINNISDVSIQSLDSYILSSNKLQPSSSNLVESFYRNGMSLNSYIVAFINNNDFDFNDINQVLDNSTYPKDIKSKFAEVIARENSIVEDKYKSILKELNFELDNISYSFCDVTHMSILVKLALISMNLSNLNVIRNYFGNIVYEYISSDIGGYVAIGNYDFNEIVNMVQKDILVDDKLALLSCTANSLSIRNKDLEDEVNEYILINNFDINDLSYVCANYDSFGPCTQNTIENKVVENKEYIVRKKISCCKNLILKIVDKIDLDSAQKKTIIYNNMENMSVSEWEECFTAAKENQIAGLFNKGRAHLNDNSLNRLILDKLISRNIIKRFEVRNNKLISYRS